MRGWKVVMALGCVSMACGALMPWVLPEHEEYARLGATSAAAGITSTRIVGPAIAAAPADASAPDPQGVIAIGDSVMLAARECLEREDIDVYPRDLATAEELVSTVQRLSRDHAVIFVHAGHDHGLVDGQIQRVITAAGSSARVIWSTIRVSVWEGEFSFEDRTNASIRNIVGRHDQGLVMDWQGMTRDHPERLPDGTTMSTEGCRDYARKVAKLSGLARKA